MGIKLLDKLSSGLIRWLLEDRVPIGLPYCDYEHLIYDIKPCDVILVEGRSRTAEVTKLMTQSRWSHAGLYIGRLHDIPCAESREIVKQHYHGDPDEPLIVEGFLGKGIIVSPLSIYKDDHLRVCRPKGISRQDTVKVINYAVDHVGREYNTRQILDLARFLFPWGILPRRWRSCLFRQNIGDNTRQICSSLIAEAFISVRYPILPLVVRDQEQSLKLAQRNPKLYTPSDFDYSPYFEILKYPLFDLGQSAIYRHLPWNGGKDEQVHIQPITIDASYVRNEEATAIANETELAPSEQYQSTPAIEESIEAEEIELPADIAKDVLEVDILDQIPKEPSSEPTSKEDKSKTSV